MKKQEFIEKWNVGYEDFEGRHEFANEMMRDLDAVIQSEIEAYNAQFEGECEWKETIFNDIITECDNAHDKNNIYNYCPFCGRKIKRT